MLTTRRTGKPPLPDREGIRFADNKLEIFALRERAAAQGDPLFADSEVLLFDLRKPRVRQPREDLLGRFLEIRTPEDAEDFARVYGALELCRHGLPHRHPFLTALGKDGRIFKNDPDTCRPLERVRDGKWLWTEAVAAWLAWAAQARLVLQAGTLLHRKEPPATPEELRAELAQLYEPGLPFKLYFESYSGLRRGELVKTSPAMLPALWANIWLGLSGVTLRCGLKDGVLRLEPCAPTCPLLGFISLQLAQAVCGTRELARCAVCGNPCAPGRVTEGRNSYCPTHRDRGRFQVAKRKARELERKIRKLREQGRSTAVIATELAVDKSRVRKTIERIAP
jgi:hypothetical protein